mgnify:CR=1 FL=1|jgi:hypothetical protein
MCLIWSISFFGTGAGAGSGTFCVFGVSYDTNFLIKLTGSFGFSSTTDSVIETIF